MPNLPKGTTVADAEPPSRAIPNQYQITPNSARIEREGSANERQWTQGNSECQQTLARVGCDEHLSVCREAHAGGLSIDAVRRGPVPGATAHHILRVTGRQDAGAPDFVRLT